MSAGSTKLYDTLRETGRYETPPHAAWPLLHIRILTRLWFNLIFVTQVIIGGSQVILGRFSQAAFVERSYPLIWALEKAGARFRIEGAHHILKVDGPAVFVGNHMSSLETVALPCIIVPFKPCAFIIKESLANYPMFGRIVRQLTCITVSRKNARADLQKVLSEGPQRLQQGLSLVIFPQSTRAPRLDPAKFGTLGHKLAREAGVPVIPVALRTDLWQPGKWLKDFGPMDVRRPVYIEFGEPQKVEGKGKAEHQATVDFIQTRHDTWFA